MDLKLKPCDMCSTAFSISCMYLLEPEEELKSES